MRVQLKNDHVQGIDTKRDEVLLSVTEFPEEGILEILMQEKAPILRGTETSHGIVSRRKRCSEENRQVMLDWNKWFAGRSPDRVSIRKQNTNLTKQQLKLHSSKLTANCKAKPSRTATFMFFATAFMLGIHLELTFSDFATLHFSPSHPGHLHVANGDEVDTHPLLDSTSAFDDKPQLFISVLSVLLSLFPEPGCVLFVFGPSIFLGHAQPSVSVLFPTHHLYVDAFVHLPGTIADTSPRSDAEGASEDRVPTAS